MLGINVKPTARRRMRELQCKLLAGLFCCFSRSLLELELQCKVLQVVFCC